MAHNLDGNAQIQMGRLKKMLAERNTDLMEAQQESVALAQRVKKAEKESKEQTKQQKKEIQELQAQMQEHLAELNSLRKQREEELQEKIDLFEEEAEADNLEIVQLRGQILALQQSEAASNVADSAAEAAAESAAAAEQKLGSQTVQLNALQKELALWKQSSEAANEEATTLSTQLTALEKQAEKDRRQSKADLDEAAEAAELREMMHCSEATQQREELRKLQETYKGKIRAKKEAAGKEGAELRAQAEQKQMVLDVQEQQLQEMKEKTEELNQELQSVQEQLEESKEEMSGLQEEVSGLKEMLELALDEKLEDQDHDAELQELRDQVEELEEEIIRIRKQPMLKPRKQLKKTVVTKDPVDVSAVVERLSPKIDKVKKDASGNTPKSSPRPQYVRGRVGGLVVVPTPGTKGPIPTLEWSGSRCGGGVISRAGLASPREVNKQEEATRADDVDPYSPLQVKLPREEIEAVVERLTPKVSSPKPKRSISKQKSAHYTRTHVDGFVFVPTDGAPTLSFNPYQGRSAIISQAGLREESDSDEAAQEDDNGIFIPRRYREEDDHRDKKQAKPQVDVNAVVERLFPEPAPRKSPRKSAPVSPRYARSVVDGMVSVPIPVKDGMISTLEWSGRANGGAVIGRAGVSEPRPLPWKSTTESAHSTDNQKSGQLHDGEDPHQRRKSLNPKEVEACFERLSPKPSPRTPRKGHTQLSTPLSPRYHRVAVDGMVTVSTPGIKQGTEKEISTLEWSSRAESGVVFARAGISDGVGETWQERAQKSPVLRAQAEPMLPPRPVRSPPVRSTPAGVTKLNLSASSIEEASPVNQMISNMKLDH